MTNFALFPWERMCDVVFFVKPIISKVIFKQLWMYYTEKAFKNVDLSKYIADFTK